MEQMQAEKLTVIGKLTAPYGVKGWIKIHSYTDPIDNVFCYSPWQVKRGEQWFQVKLESSKRHGKGLIAKLAGIDTPEQVRDWSNAEIYVAQHQLPELETGEYYWSQLENLLVYTESGELLGRVDHLIETGSNDVFVVKATANSRDKVERLIPYLPEQVVKEIDLEKGTMRVDWDPEF
ncbi:ribosome maturation factor RimM [Nitrincola iocasae]|jgi:16S rRNA processing protein RimM|uniref:Ribosome maturation factor RimM n=2 Tax=Nitrincola iocasae TaxID=2614693 RepID=A0A5J6LH53_9GAMM|nr:ribosome maturation factor RimM [Nitrincola iocasae]